MCDCNFFCRILCAVILIIAFVFNTIGNWIGVGDIIPTDKCLFGCTCHETTIEETTDISTGVSEEYTTLPSTTEVTEPSTEDVTEPATTAPDTTATTTAPAATTTTTLPATTTTRHTTTRPPETDAGPHIQTAAEVSLSVFGGKGDDIIRGIAATSDGGYVVCGTTTSTNGNFESLYTKGWKSPYSFVARYTKTGTLKWVKAFASTSASLTLEDVAVLSDGTIVAVGYTQATDYAANTESKGTVDAIVFKLTSTGYLKTKKSFGGDKSDMFTCVAATESGFVVGGKTYSTTGDFADIPGTSAILMNFDSDINILWKKYLHGNAASTIGGVAVDGAGNVFATCLTSSTTGDFSVFENLSGGYTDTVVLKYDAAGEYKWGYVISSSGRDEFAAVAPDGNGGCVVAGNYELMPSPIPDGTLSGIHHCGNIDALVFRINANGTQRWVKTLSGMENDFITDIVKTDGGFAITGYSASSNREFAEAGNEGLYDGFVSFVNTNGVTVKTFTQAGTQDDMAECLVYTTEGEIFAAGKTKSADCDFADLNTYASSAYLGYIGRYQITVE